MGFHFHGSHLVWKTSQGGAQTRSKRRSVSWEVGGTTLAPRRVLRGPMALCARLAPSTYSPILLAALFSYSTLFLSYCM